MRESRDRRRANQKHLKNQRKKPKNRRNSFPRRDRAIVYIDGFNLYYGIRQKGWRKLLWLDLRQFAINLLPKTVDVEAVHYFTARIDGGHHTETAAKQAQQQASRRRQFDYLTALGTLPIVNIVEGRFLRKKQRCQACGVATYVPEEKKSDVNIATQLLADAFHNRYDVAVVVSGDSDLADTIEFITREFPRKQVIIAFPPERKSMELRKVATAAIDVYRMTLKRSQLPDTVAIRKGSVKRPVEWR